MSRAARGWRRPALHFALLGAALFALDASTGAPAPARAGAGAASDEELLVREARRLGLHETDPLVARRLARNMRFLGVEGADSPDALAEAARALGMDRTDPVVRRRLAQALVLRTQAVARAREPDEAELAEFLERHAERFREPARVRLSQVFLSRERRGAALERDALALLQRLDASGDAGAAPGDPFPWPRELPPRSERELAQVFGPAGARAVFALPAGGWAGPVESPYGLHLVRVRERRPATAPPLAKVRGAVREALLAERADRALAALLRELRG